MKIKNPSRFIHVILIINILFYLTIFLVTLNYKIYKTISVNVTCQINGKLTDFIINSKDIKFPPSEICIINSIYVNNLKKILSIKYFNIVFDKNHNYILAVENDYIEISDININNRNAILELKINEGNLLNKLFEINKNIF
jgi:hypothetical protein